MEGREVRGVGLRLQLQWDEALSAGACCSGG
jgi:hypothetical protein